MQTRPKKQPQKGKKPRKEELAERAEEREGKEASRAIKATRKTVPIGARKDNHEKRPEVKKKRGTSTGYMPG